MRVIYYGGTFCGEQTFKRLLLVAKEIGFIDRPSVKLSERSGTIGVATEARFFPPVDPKSGIAISAHSPYNEAVPVYQDYLRRDWQNRAFRRAVLDGLNNPAFAQRMLQMDADYGGATGRQIRDALLSDPALRAPDLPALEHRTMFQIDTPEARIETLGCLVSEASIIVSGGLVGAGETGFAPLTDDDTLASLFAIRCAEAPGRGGGEGAALAMIGDELARAVLPDWVLAQIKIEDILEYRANTKNAYDAWLAELDAVVVSIEELEGEELVEEARKLVRSRLTPKVGEYKRAMASVRDSMFGELISSAPSWAVPAAAAYLVAGPVIGLITALGTAGLKTAATYYNGLRKARRDHGISYLLRLVEEQKPLLDK